MLVFLHSFNPKSAVGKKLSNKLGLALAEQVCEVLRVKLGEAAAVVDGLTYDEHRGERQVVVVNNLRKILELTAIDLLIGPRQVIAGSDGCVLWIFH